MSQNQTQPTDEELRARAEEAAKKANVSEVESQWNSASASKESEKRSREDDDSDEPKAKRSTAHASPPKESKKRSREDDDSDEPKAKRSTTYRSLESSYSRVKRQKNYVAIRNCETWKDCKKLFMDISEQSTIGVALALNDAKEEHRLILAEKLDESYLKDIVDILIHVRMDNDLYDPKSLYPVIALGEYFKTLSDPSERSCNICKGEFQDFTDMIPKPCGKHYFHTKCLTEALNAKKSPFFALCNCHLVR